MRIRNFVYSLSLTGILGGMSISLTGCGSGEQKNTLTLREQLEQTVYLHSGYVTEKYQLQNGRTYSLSVIDHDNNEIIIDQEPFSCNVFSAEIGCKLILPATKSKNGSLSFIIYSGNDLMAATSIQKSAIPTGLNNIYFNENTTGEYIFDQVREYNYINTGSNYLVSPILKQDTKYDVNDLELNVKFFLVYKELEKQYHADAIYYMVEAFNPNIPIASTIIHNENNLGSSPMIGCDNILTLADGTKSCNEIKTKEELNTKLGSVLGLGMTKEEYKEANAEIKAAEDKEKSKTKAAENKAKKEEKQKEKAAKSKALISQAVGKAASETGNLTKSITKELKQQLGIKLSKNETQILTYANSAIKILGTFGSVWLPGVAPMVTGVLSGFIDGVIGGTGNENAIKVNPMAKVEVLLGEISIEISKMGGYLKDIENTLVELDTNNNRVKVSDTIIKLNEIPDEYDSIAHNALIAAENQGGVFETPEQNLSVYLNKDPDGVMYVESAFVKSGKDGANYYTGILTQLNLLVDINSSSSQSALDNYLSGREKALKVMLKNVGTDTSMTFTLSNNKIDIVQQYNLGILEQMSDITKTIVKIGEYYKLAAYLKYKAKGNGYNFYNKINLGGKFQKGNNYENAIELINDDVETRIKVLEGKVQKQIKTATTQVSEEYMEKFDAKFPWYKANLSESQNANRCIPEYWDGTTFMGKCGERKFIIPDVHECKNQIAQHGNRVYCDTLNFYNVDKFTDSVAGSKNISSATDNMLQQQSIKLKKSTNYAVRYSSGEWHNNSFDIRNALFKTSMYPNMKDEDNGVISNNECLGLKSILFMTQLYSDTKCKGGTKDAKWWLNGNKVSWAKAEENHSIHRAYVNIEDTSNGRIFMIPSITKYQDYRAMLSPDERRFSTFSTLACTTSDCVVLDAGGIDKNAPDKHRKAVISYIASNKDNNNLTFDEFGKVYFLGIDKTSEPTSFAVKQAGIQYNFFTLYKSSIKDYKKDFNGNMMPSGDWLTKCDNHEFINGMVVRASECNSGSTGAKTTTNQSLNWALECEAGSPVDVENTSYDKNKKKYNESKLVCRYPITKAE